jgi:hypothetical protein|nr:MAG TPA: hypothetical protein [Caudoviricetes sp.]
MESFAEYLVVNCNGILLPSVIISLYLKTGTPQFWLLGGVWIGVLAA